MPMFKKLWLFIGFSSCVQTVKETSHSSIGGIEWRYEKKGKTKCKAKGVANNTLMSKNGNKQVLQLDIIWAKEERSDAESTQKLI